jgi:cellulose synthase/poly-beta-1,6-N-acetylglucosamine synthase-like glycosyltransferase
MRDALVYVLQAFDAVMLVYLLALDVVYGVLAAVGWRAVNRFVRRRSLRDYEAVAESPLSLPISILAPAYNEQPTIVTSIRALLGCRYREFEVIVINDGSTDGTLAAVQEAFELVPVERVPRANLHTKPVQAVYASPLDERVVVIDKDNGGKADALNVGLRYAAYPLVCAIDADTLLDPGALARLAWEFQASPDTVAVGGIVRIVNGSRVQDGKVVDVSMPRRLIVDLQILEYLRAFLGGRVAWSRLGMLLIISGAFGLFRRDAVIDAGGYDTGTVGEDAELVLRLYRTRADQGQPCRVTFFPDPICWTEAPATLRVLTRQRDRWQRGLIEMLRKHHGMVGRRRYGLVGLVALPYFLIFEAFGPLLEVGGYVAFAVTLALGLGTAAYAALFLGLSLTYGLILSFVTVLMEERAFRRYPDWSDLLRLAGMAIIENLGYRQYLSLVRVRGWWTYLRGNTGWGEMTRAGFTTPTPTPATDTTSA